MSAGSDNIFARWSRRKQAVRDSEAPPPHVKEDAFDAAAAEVDGEPVDRQLARAEPNLAEPAEPLPRLEDLTAESDLSAFLREGVPKALKSAAMRKMWALDPAIRDYIGPSEYAWDFNQPGSMAGFGPLDDAGEHVAEFLSRMSGGMRTARADADAAVAPETPPAPQHIAAAAPDQDASEPPDDPAEASPPTPALEPPPAPADSEPAEAAKPADSPIISAPPRHGRAMPR